MLKTLPLALKDYPVGISLILGLIVFNLVSVVIDIVSVTSLANKLTSVGVSLAALCLIVTSLWRICMFYVETKKLP